MQSLSRPLIPELRFAEFSKVWNTKTLKNFGVQIIDGDRGKNYPNGDDFSPDGHCLFLSAKNVTTAGFAFTELSFISEEKDAALSKGKLQVSDVVLTTRGTVGNIALFDADLPFEHLRINSGMVLLRAIKSAVTPCFLYAAMFAPPLSREVKKTAFGSAQPQLTVKGIYALKFSAPADIIEQQKIADFLTAVDTRIQQLSQKKTLLERWKKGLMQQLFSQTLRFKDDDGNDFPDWEERRLGSLCSTLKSGKGITSELINEDGLYPVFGGNGLRGYTDSFTHDCDVVLIGRQGALCGNINRSVGKSYISEHAVAVIANESSRNEWLAQRLEYMKLNRLSESSAQPGLAVNKLARLKLDTPSHEEQTKIANCLSAIDKKIDTVGQQIEKTKTFKQGLLQQMFV